ncbi:MAG TPA: glycosyltransferase family 39 protein [Leptolyngbyaceae cyanobacterium M65_K2018_010]|nr:glycosyltransferase family 39 protein [Leptolyngbyaceae cyanobacterium M65_K2018_010]
MLSKRLSYGLRSLLHQEWLWLLLWAGGLILLSHPQQSLMAYDEGYYAQQARWMLEKNDWITVGWWGSPIFDRTIGAQWLIALSYHWFGRSEWAARLPSIVASVVSIFLTWRIGRRLLPPTAGLWGAAILAVMPLWMQSTKLATQDMVLVALELFAIWALLHSEDHPHQRIGWGMLAGIALSIGFLAKSVMIVLPAIALLPYLIWSHRSNRHLTNLGLYYGLLFGAVPSAIWLSRSVARYGPLPLNQLFEKVILLSRAGSESATPATFQSTTTITYYLWHIPATTFPWVLFALVGAWLLWRHPQVGRRTLWLGYPVVLLMLLSLFDTRTWYYSLQIYPFLALLAGVGLEHLGRWYRSRAPRRYRVAVGLSWAIGVLAILFLSAGAALLLTPGELIGDEIRPYGWLGVLGGVGWLVPWLMAVNRPHRVSLLQQKLWQWGWLLGPWLGIAAAFLTGLWGNYSPAIKTALTTEPIAPILAHHAIHMIQPGGDRDTILLTFYTPHLGRPLTDWSQIPSEEYAWGNGRIVPLPEAGGYEIIATLGDWHLVRAPFLPPMTPRG